MTSATFHAAFATLAAQADAEPVILTRDGADAFVVLTTEAYVALTNATSAHQATDAIADTDLDAIEWNR